jgi:UDP-N-acetylglucosamine 1-carboxyvinyltransferase
MSTFVIQGENRLEGEVIPSGNKNEVLPAICACLLTDQDLILTRVPRIKDVLTLCRILEEIGVTVEWLEEDTLKLNAKYAEKKPLNESLCSKIRASILLLGPMLARFGGVEMPLPGGDVIGARRLDTHFEGFEQLGAQMELAPHRIEARLLKRTPGTVHLYLDEPSVTGTENLLLLACLGEGKTVLHNAASEPHVEGLCRLLNAMGSQIQGVGTNRLEIQGVKKLSGCTHRIGPDFMEIGSFLCLGAMAGGHLRISQVELQDLRFILKTFARLGIEPVIGEDFLEIDGRKTLSMKTDISGRLGSIYSGPWPAFPTDLMSVAIVCATQSKGTMIFHEKMFEGRMFFTDKLMAMGANIVLCDPHRAVVTGPTPLSSAHMSSPDLRAGMAILMAAVIAKGSSRIDNIYQIERGYYRIEEKLRALGVSITRE